MSAAQAQTLVGLRQLAVQWVKENERMSNATPGQAEQHNEPQPLAAVTPPAADTTSGSDNADDDDIRSTAPTQVLLPSQQQQQQPQPAHSSDSAETANGNWYYDHDLKYLSQPQSVLQHSPTHTTEPETADSGSNDEYMPRSQLDNDDTEDEEKRDTRGRNEKEEEEDEEEEEEEEEEKRAADGHSDADSDSVDGGSVQIIEPAQQRPHLQSTVQRVRGESAMQHAERELANTTDDTSSLDLHRIRCQWFAQACVIRYTEQEHFNNDDHLDFFTVQTDVQRAECDNHGIVAYGDLCPRHARILLGVYVAPSRELCGGMGLFTSWPRDKGDIICEYKGTIRRQVHDNDHGDKGRLMRQHSKYAIVLPEHLTAEIARGCRVGHSSDDSDHNSSGSSSSSSNSNHNRGGQPPRVRFTPAAPARPFVLDASRTTDGFARFINDTTLGRGSSESSRTNCEFVKGLEIDEEHEWQVLVRATRAIPAKAELSVWYDKGYWSILRESPAMHTARCPQPLRAAWPAVDRLRSPPRLCWCVCVCVCVCECAYCCCSVVLSRRADARRASANQTRSHSRSHSHTHSRSPSQPAKANKRRRAHRPENSNSNNKANKRHESKR